MIANPYFVFLHLSKSGGTFINRLLMDEFEASVRLGYHLPYHKIPDVCRSLPILGSVRNPWDYYVSWFHFHDRIRKSVVWKVFSENGRFGFEQTLFKMLDNENREPFLDSIQEKLPIHHPNKGSNLTKQCIESFRNSKKGWYSLLFDLLYTDAKNVYFMRLDSLRDDFYSYLNKTNYPLTSRIHTEIFSAPKRNTSKHQHYSSYYSDELRKLVEEKDAEIVNRFQFEFCTEHE